MSDMRIRKLIDVLKKLEKKHGDCAVKLTTFAVCGEEGLSSIAITDQAVKLGRRQSDETMHIVHLRSGRYIDYIEDPDS